MSDKYWSTFSKHMRDQAKDLKKLPIAHNTDYINFLSIMEERALCGLKKDIFFGDKRIFFYYGVPAYINEDDIFPSIFVFDVKDDDFLNEFDWVFMDSGTLNLLRTKSFLNTFQHLSSDIIKENYVLKRENGTNSIDFIKGHIKYFFGNNSNYYNGKIVINTNGKINNTYFLLAQKYYNITKDLNPEDIKKVIYSDYKKIDRRDRIIEGSSNIPVRLVSLKCVACFIPEHALNVVLDFFDLDEKDIRFYPDSPNGRAKEEIIKEGMEWIEKVLKNRLIE
ncbi:hypothetical protein ACE1ET_15180 [Saccharicrinis sp. FJH62]|uniref:hypothetical protein n=1 Tax=Saccharicrinis sp. FJH62 TaxID=3344657 RepID=UPI0035D4A6FC